MVRTQTDYFHKIPSFYENSKCFIKFYMLRSFCKCRRAAWNGLAGRSLPTTPVLV